MDVLFQLFSKSFFAVVLLFWTVSAMTNSLAFVFEPHKYIGHIARCHEVIRCKFREGIWEWWKSVYTYLKKRLQIDNYGGFRDCGPDAGQFAKGEICQGKFSLSTVAINPTQRMEYIGSSRCLTEHREQLRNNRCEKPGRQEKYFIWFPSRLFMFIRLYL